MEADPCGKADVYDCTVLLVQCFCANGIVAHNCGENLRSNRAAPLQFVEGDRSEAGPAGRNRDRCLLPASKGTSYG